MPPLPQNRPPASPCRRPPDSSDHTKATPQGFLRRCTSSAQVPATWHRHLFYNRWKFPSMARRPPVPMRSGAGPAAGQGPLRTSGPRKPGRRPAGEHARPASRDHGGTGRCAKPSASGVGTTGRAATAEYFSAALRGAAADGVKAGIHDRTAPGHACRRGRDPPHCSCRPSCRPRPYCRTCPLPGKAALNWTVQG